MPLLVISSIGTSLITNSDKTLGRDLFFKSSNATSTEIAPEARAVIDSAMGKARLALASADRRGVKQLSAELNGILSLLDETAPLAKSKVHHVLIATDTYAGQATAALVAEWLQTLGHSVDTQVPPGLRVDNLAEFRASLPILTRDLLPMIADYRQAQYEVVFNLTGGFKGVPGFLQTVATIAGVEAVYVFEGSTQLMRIPRLPVRIDTLGVVESNFELYRSLAAGHAVPEATVRSCGIPETLLFIDDGKALLSEWGEVAWDDAWRTIAARTLMPVRNGRVTVSKAFEKDVKGLDGKRLFRINDSLEALVRRSEDNPAGMLKSYELKKLSSAQPDMKTATHELYAGTQNDDLGRILLMRRDGGGWEAMGWVPHL